MNRSEMPLKPGQQLWLDCKIRPGMFPSEKSVLIELTHSRVISGFVPKEFVKDKGTLTKGKIAVLVTGPPKDGKVSILFPGEILTSTNPVEMETAFLSRQLSHSDPNV